MIVGCWRGLVVLSSYHVPHVSICDTSIIARGVDPYEDWAAQLTVCTRYVLQATAFVLKGKAAKSCEAERKPEKATE